MQTSFWRLLELKHASHQCLDSLLADTMKIDGTAFEPEDPAALCQSLQSSGREPSQIRLNQKQSAVHIFGRKRFASLIFTV